MRKRSINCCAATLFGPIVLDVEHGQYGKVTDGVIDIIEQLIISPRTGSAAVDIIAAVVKRHDKLREYVEDLVAHGGFTLPELEETLACESRRSDRRAYLAELADIGTLAKKWAEDELSSCVGYEQLIVGVFQSMAGRCLDAEKGMSPIIDRTISPPRGHIRRRKGDRPAGARCCDPEGCAETAALLLMETEPRAGPVASQSPIRRGRISQSTKTLAS